jgi:hypothetical protein
VIGEARWRTRAGAQNNINDIFFFPGARALRAKCQAKCLGKRLLLWHALFRE